MLKRMQLCRVHHNEEEFRADFPSTEKLLSLYTKNPIIPLLFARITTGGIIIFWVNIRGKRETDPCWPMLKRKRATIDFNIESFSPAPRLPVRNCVMQLIAFILAPTLRWNK